MIIPLEDFINSLGRVSWDVSFLAVFFFLFCQVMIFVKVFCECSLSILATEKKYWKP